LQEIVTGMVTIADEVANGKINDPFSQQDVTWKKAALVPIQKLILQTIFVAFRIFILGTFQNATGVGISSVINLKMNRPGCCGKIQHRSFHTKD
jgi:hypothetical protein